MSRKPRVPGAGLQRTVTAEAHAEGSIEKRARILAAGRRLFAGKGYTRQPLLLTSLLKREHLSARSTNTSHPNERPRCRFLA